jgi:4a-hydroxytetrahydrobiopterin dehydratase
MEPNATLTGERLEQAVKTINVGWAVLPGKGLVRVIETGGFKTGFMLVTGVARLAEERAYDPEVTIRRNEVEITLNTYAAGGITESDVAMAQAVDTLVA